MHRKFENTDHVEAKKVIGMFGEFHNKNISEFFAGLGATINRYRGAQDLMRSVEVPDDILL